MFGRKKKNQKPDLLEEDLEDYKVVEESSNQELEDDLFGTVWGGKLGDTDPRTKMSIRLNRIFNVLVTIGIIGIGLTGYGYYKYHSYTISNSTKFGTPLTFQKEQATVTLKGVYTDKEKDVTVVELGYSDMSHSKLSSKGTNYGINLVVDSMADIPKGLKIYYGLLGTDGNGYLIIDGKLKKEAYQFFILNRFSFDTTSAGLGTTDSSMDLENTSVEKMIANMNFKGANKNGIFSNMNQTAKGQDTINFRVNPYSDNTVTYNTSFRNAKGEVDFDKVVKTVGVSKLVKTLETKMELSKEQIKSYSNAIEENTSRLLENPSDDKAKANLKTAQDNYNLEKQKYDEAKLTKEEIEKKSFSADSFPSINTKYKAFVK